MRTRLINLLMPFAGIAFSLSLQLAPVAGQGRKLRDSKSVPAKGNSATTAWPTHRPDSQPDVQGIWVTKVYGMSCLTDPTRGVGCFEAQDGPANPNRPPRKAAICRSERGSRSDRIGTALSTQLSADGV